MDKKYYIKPQTELFEYRMKGQLLIMSDEDAFPLGNDWLAETTLEGHKNEG